MLGRAFIFSAIALLAAVFGWSGWLDSTAALWVRGISYVAVGGVVVSLLFSLFEEPAPTEPVHGHQ